MYGKAISVKQQFGEVIDIILRHKSRASKSVNVNEDLLLTAWHSRGYVSAKNWTNAEDTGIDNIDQPCCNLAPQDPMANGRYGPLRGAGFCE